MKLRHKAEHGSPQADQIRIVCGLLSAVPPSVSKEMAERGRSTTVTYLRWNYFGDIIEGPTVDDIVDRAAAADYDLCFLQAAGHILPDQWNPKQEEALEFFPALRHYAAETDFFVAGELLGIPDIGTDMPQGLQCRWMVVNLSRFRDLGRPTFAGAPDGAAWIRAGRDAGIDVAALNPALRGLMLDLGPDLTGGNDFMAGLEQRSRSVLKTVFPWNLESYDDVSAPPPNWQGPLTRLYSVAAGLKPNVILQTHGFNEDTEVTFFDYSDYALRFRRLLSEEWDGRNYPAFLREVVRQLPSDTHYYLWPGAAADAVETPEIRALWAREIERWGGEDVIETHWRRARKLRYNYVVCNMLTDAQPLFQRMGEPRGAIWWSNSFQTAFTAQNYTIEEKQRIYERWIARLVKHDPEVLLYGSDHSNSSVNGFGAKAYQAAYQLTGGDPLLARRLNRHVIRF